MDLHIDAALSALMGSGLSAAFARAFIGKSLRELDSVVQKVTEIKVELAAIAVKLAFAEKNHDMMLTHERKIAAIESKINVHG